MSRESFEIEFSPYRCNECKRYYKAETGQCSDCAHCKKRLAESLNLRLSDMRGEHNESCNRYERQLSALRGVITRLKKRKAR